MIHNGYQIKVNDNRFGVLVKRSWKERLCTKPWQPLVKEKLLKDAGAYIIPDGQVIMDKLNSVCYMNRKTYESFKHAMKNVEQPNWF